MLLKNVRPFIFRRINFKMNNPEAVLIYCSFSVQFYRTYETEQVLISHALPKITFSLAKKMEKLKSIFVEDLTFLNVMQH